MSRQVMNARPRSESGCPESGIANDEAPPTAISFSAPALRISEEADAASPADLAGGSGPVSFQLVFNGVRHLGTGV